MIKLNERRIKKIFNYLSVVDSLLVKIFAVITFLKKKSFYTQNSYEFRQLWVGEPSLNWVLIKKDALCSYTSVMHTKKIMQISCIVEKNYNCVTVTKIWRKRLWKQSLVSHVWEVSKIYYLIFQNSSIY